MKQIEEKHALSESIYMSGHGLDWKDSDDIAEQLYTEGYRKQSEVASEIFEEIEKIINDDRINRKLAELGLCFVRDEEPTFEERITELKNKYTEVEK